MGRHVPYKHRGSLGQAVISLMMTVGGERKENLGSHLIFYLFVKVPSPKTQFLGIIANAYYHDAITHCEDIYVLGKDFKRDRSITNERVRHVIARSSCFLRGRVTFRR